MPPKITENNFEFWYQLIKTDVGVFKFYVPILIFYIIDISVLIFNIVTHLKNGAYLAFVLTCVIHVASAFLISYLYKCNEDAIDEYNPAFQSDHQRWWVIFRQVSRWLGITPLFLILSNWNDLKVKHKTIKTQRILRKDINETEIDAVVQNKKRKLVKSYFDCIHAYFKTLPQCILQIYLAVDTHLPLIFCTMTDVMRVVTMAWSIILASKVCAEYTCFRSEYLKAIQFQDYFTYGHNDGINTLRKRQFWACFPFNLAIVGSRLYAIAFLLTVGGPWAAVQIVFLFILNILWIRTSSATRPVYENPPSGKTTLTSDLVDRIICIFCFHEIRPEVKNVIIHWFLFCMVFFAIQIVYTSISWTFLTDNLVQSYQNPAVTMILMCNFSVFSFSNGLTQYFHEIINSHWKPKFLGGGVNVTSTVNISESVEYQTDSFGAHFKEIFSNEIVAFSLLVISGLFSISYSVYLKRGDPNCHNNSEFPLQISMKVWRKFLAEDWKETKNVSKALKLLLLGVLDTNELELCNFQLPNDVQELQEFLKSFLEIKKNNYQEENPISLSIYPNPYNNSLKRLTQFLIQNKLEEAAQVSIYFQKYFYGCMDEMTSHRIAQTEAILLGGNFYSRFSCEIRCYYNNFIIYFREKNSKIYSDSLGIGTQTEFFNDD